VLLRGDVERARSFVAKGLVDNIVIFVPALNSSHSPPETFLPPGFGIESVQRDSAGIVLSLSATPENSPAMQVKAK
jgi:hypothetical protein